jgi:hypothetical protein
MTTDPDSDGSRTLGIRVENSERPIEGAGEDCEPDEGGEGEEEDEEAEERTVEGVLAHLTNHGEHH